MLPPGDLYTVIAGLVPSAVMPGLSRPKGRRALHAYVPGIRLGWEDDDGPAFARRRVPGSALAKNAAARRRDKLGHEVDSFRTSPREG